MRVELVERPDVANARTQWRGGRDAIEHVAHEAGRIANTAACDIAHEALETHQNRLERDALGVLAVVQQKIDQARGHPPYPDRRIQLIADLIQRVQCTAHGLQGVPVVRLSDPSHQPALETRARRCYVTFALRGVETIGATCVYRYRAHVGEEQLVLGDVGAFAQLPQFAVHGEELQRHIGLALGEVVEKLRQGKQCPVDDRGRQFVEARRSRGKTLHGLFERAAEACRALQVQHLQRTADVADRLHTLRQAPRPIRRFA